MKRWTALLLCCALLLSGCAGREGRDGEDGTAYVLYFMAKELEEIRGGGALCTETVYLRDMEDAEPQELATALMTELLKGPLDEGLKSPIPAGTSLLSLEVAGSRALVEELTQKAVDALAEFEQGEFLVWLAQSLAKRTN